MKKLLSFLLVLAMLATLLAGCSGAAPSSPSASSTNPGDEQSATSMGEKTEITAYWTDVMNPPSGRILEHVNEKFDMNLSFTILPIGEWANHINLGMASGKLANVLQIRHDVALTENLIKSGKLYDMTDKLADYPNLKAYLDSPEAKPYAVWQGRYYAVPREWVNDCEVMYYRKDLLDKYNLEVPSTLDEYYTTMKTIVESEASMVGFTESLGGTLFTFLKQFNGWGADCGVYEKTADGGYTDIMVMPETKEGLKYINKLYQAKILDPEFMLNMDYEKIIGAIPSGKSASVRAQCNSGYYYDRLKKLTEKNIPDGEIFAQNVPSGKYEYRPTNSPCADVWMSISSDCPAPEKVMAMWDWMFSPEGKEFLSYGIEGVHYTKDAAGKITMNDEEVKKETEDMLTDPLNKFQWYSDISSDVFYSWAEDVQRQQELFDYNKSIAVTPLVQGFSSENYVKYIGDMSKVRDEYFTKFITGEYDIDAKWDEFVAEYNRAGNELIIPEVNAFMQGK